MNAKCLVLVVYQDTAARQEAVKFCDLLVQKFWRQTTFDLDWRQWEDLQDNAGAQQTAARAQAANIIVLSISIPGTIKPFVQSWLELTLGKRGEREGILVGLSAPQDLPQNAKAAATQQYLRKLAHQSGLDYLASVPQSLSYGVPETLEACKVRATQVTSVLDTILHHSPAPPVLL